MGKKKSVRQAVLDAAVALVEQTGAGTLTLDAVALRAGVSKGGLLHHFKSKEALLTAMMADVLRNFEEELNEASASLLAAGNDGHNAHSREQIEAYLERAFSGLGSKNRSAMALFAAAAHQPSLLEPIRDYFRRRTEHTIANFPEPMLALALAALADGLWLFDALGLPPFEGKVRDQVRREVLRWANAALDAAEHKTRVPPPDAPAPAPAPRRKPATASR